MSQKPSYYLTAYGIALKHGFKGTEEEWLNSLTAFYLAQQAGYPGTIDEWLQDLNEPIPKFEIGRVTTLDGGSNAFVEIGGTARNPVLHFGIPRGLGMVDALPLVGGTMKGCLDMAGHKLFNLPDPSGEQDAVPKKCLDATIAALWNRFGEVILRYLPLSGGEMRGNLTMKGFRLEGLADPVSEDHAATKRYVDAESKKLSTKAEKFTFSLTVPASSWIGTQPPYTQSLALEGILETDNPYFAPDFSGGDPRYAFGCIDILETQNNKIMLTCLDRKPDRDITLRMEVFR